MCPLWLKTALVVSYVRQRDLVAFGIRVGIRPLSDYDVSVFGVIALLQGSCFLGFYAVCRFVTGNSEFIKSKIYMN